MAFLGLDKLAGYVAGGAKLADKTAKDEGKLLYPSFLNYDLSADDNWSIVSGQNKYVVADIVSYDSSTPLKKRDSISVYSGKLPKRAIKRALNESEIMQFKSLRNNGATEEQLAGFIFKDTPFCVMGIENSIVVITYQILYIDQYWLQQGYGIRVRNHENYAVGDYQRGNTHFGET